MNRLRTYKWAYAQPLRHRLTSVGTALVSAVSVTKAPNRYDIDSIFATVGVFTHPGKNH